MRFWQLLAPSLLVAGCVAPAPPPVVQAVPQSQPVTQVASAAVAGPKRILRDGGGGYILPDGTRVAGDRSGGFTLPNGEYVTSTSGGLILPNGTRCAPEGVGFICP